MHKTKRSTIALQTDSHKTQTTHTYMYRQTSHTSASTSRLSNSNPTFLLSDFLTDTPRHVTRKRQDSQASAVDLEAPRIHQRDLRLDADLVLGTVRHGCDRAHKPQEEQMRRHMRGRGTVSRVWLDKEYKDGCGSGRGICRRHTCGTRGLFERMDEWRNARMLT